jgi:hypothetical protein
VQGGSRSCVMKPGDGIAPSLHGRHCHRGLPDQRSVCVAAGAAVRSAVNARDPRLAAAAAHGLLTDEVVPLAIAGPCRPYPRPSTCVDSPASRPVGTDLHPRSPSENRKVGGSTPPLATPPASRNRRLTSSFRPGTDLVVSDDVRAAAADSGCPRPMRAKVLFLHPRAHPRGRRENEPNRAPGRAG